MNAINSASNPGFSADLDQQISDGVARLKMLQTQKVDADHQAFEHQLDRIAEDHGVIRRSGNTGNRGQRDYYKFHKDAEAAEKAIARAGAVEIDRTTRALDTLRQQRQETATKIAASFVLLDRQFADERATRARLASERERLESGRNTWIDEHVRQAPGYVPPQQGLLARLDGLAAILGASRFLSGFAAALKLFILVLESIGPVTKICFSRPTIYAIAVAMRIHDVAALDADRHAKWANWRLAVRYRASEAVDAMDTWRRARESKRRTQNAATDAFLHVLGTKAR